MRETAFLSGYSSIFAVSVRETGCKHRQAVCGLLSDFLGNFLLLLFLLYHLPLRSPQDVLKITILLFSSPAAISRDVFGDCKAMREAHVTGSYCGFENGSRVVPMACAWDELFPSRECE